MRFTWIFIAILAAYWCSENSMNIDPDDLIKVNSFKQIPGCLPSPLLKSTNTHQRCFEYSFHDTLELRLCLSANCCPDSNRFDEDLRVSQDTIFFTVRDTSKQLCNCICTYLLETKISGLLADRYIFQCLYNGQAVYDSLLYRHFD